MALYFGGERVTVHLGSSAYRLHLLFGTATTEGMLLSSDRYVLRDKNGAYLIPAFKIPEINNELLLSLDNKILKDYDGLYLAAMEDY